MGASLASQGTGSILLRRTEPGFAGSPPIRVTIPSAFKSLAPAHETYPLAKKIDFGLETETRS